VKIAKIDANQPEIVQALRKAGCTVQTLAAVGKGVPDLLVGLRGSNFLLEIKDGKRPPSQKKLTDDQVAWHKAWGGSVTVVENPDQALRAVGL